MFEKPKKDKIFGTVIDCTLLNVRETPSGDGTVLGTVECSAVVEVIETVDDTWCKICTEVGLEGYCMNSFIDTLSDEILDDM